MNTKRTTYSMTILAAILISASSMAQADGHNLLADPGFEERTSAKEGGWQSFKESRISEKHARSGSQSIFNWGFSRTVPYPPGFVGTVSGSFQEFPAAPGSRWQLTGYGFAPVKLEGGPAFGIVQVSFFDTDGDDLGTIETAGSKVAKAKTSNEVDGQTPEKTWVKLDTGVATAPEGTATVQAFTLYVDYSGSNIAQGVFFDDLVLCEIENAADDACD